MAQVIKIGIAGLGAAGSQVAQYISKSLKFQLTAGADSNPETLRKHRETLGIEVFSSVEDMCAKADIDAVYIATPNPVHASHVITAAKSGKHIIVDKPMAITLDDCDQMIEAANKYGVKLMVGHTRSCNPPIRKMREIISSGELGQVIQITTLHYSPWLVRPRLPAEFDTELGGGVCYRQAPHQVDVVRLLGGGKVRSVRSLTGKWDPRNNTEGNYSALLSFENGSSASLIYNAYGYFDTSELTFGIGGGGKMRKPGAGQRMRDFVAQGATKEDARSGATHLIEGGIEDDDQPHQPFFGLTIVSCERGDLRQYPDGIRVYGTDGIRDVPCSPWEGPLAVELGDFYEAVTRNLPVAHDGAWGKATLEVCLAILQSNSEQREIEMVHQVQSPF